jgi:high-affinity iron transporter
MYRIGIFCLVVILGLGTVVSHQARAADATNPASAAEIVRSALTEALLAMPADPESANKAFAEALQAYKNRLHAKLGQTAPATDRISDGFARAKQAFGKGDPMMFADARAQIWTGILAGGYAVVTQAIKDGDGETARTWLQLREFRKTTRFSRPDTNATVAIEKFLAGQISSDEALAQVEADLLDTYQARLRISIQDLRDASAKGFATRMAESASLADGYFAMLAPAYKEQRGSAELEKAQRIFAELRSSVLSGKDPASGLDQLEKLLHGFRAAPLSSEEKARRAGQLQRFISLVPIEYSRGVRNGAVVRDFEIIEAITFRDGAAAAFDDLQTALEPFDPGKTARVEELLESLQRRLLAASQQKEVADPDEIEATASEIGAILNEIMPEEWLKQNSAGDFDAVAAVLDQMESAVAQGQYDLAESARLQAYAIMETGPEPKLVAFAPQFIPELESLFWYGQGEQIGLAQLIQDRASLADIKKTREQLDSVLSKSQEAIGGINSPNSIRFNSTIIVFREGLEAVLILAALLAGLQRGEYAHLRRPLWWGTLASLVATAITWIAARELLLTLASYGERVEAVVSLMAVVILLLITNWFFHQSYWTDWLRNFQKRKWSIAGGTVGQSLAMAMLGFESIYREGFETVLFLQALVLDSSPGLVLQGVVIGMIGVSLVGLILFKIQVTLPYKKMLIVTGVLIVSVLYTMIGNTVNSFQVVGWMPLHPIRGLELPYWAGLWFGMYPTWEGMILQPFGAIFVIGSYFLAKSLQKRQTKRKAGNRVLQPEHKV